MSNTSSQQGNPAKFGPWLVGINRSYKRATLMVLDAIVLAGALWASLALRYGAIDFPKGERFDGLYFVLPIFGVGAFWFLGLYKSMLRSMEGQTIVVVCLGAAFTTLLIPIWAYFDPALVAPRSLPFIYMLVTVFGVGSIRFLLKQFYSIAIHRENDLTRIVIYGAGYRGTQLAALLQNSGDHRLIGFVDDDASLHGAKVRGRTVYPPSEIRNMYEKRGVEQMLIAIDKLGVERQRAILQHVAGLPIKVVTMPRLTVDTGQQSIENLQPIKIEDLLGRDVVEPIKGLIESGVTGKSILVTGAAGSIGSEICREILKARPASVIAFDASELGLYTLEQEFSKLPEALDVALSFKLGSILDRRAVAKVMDEHNIDVVFHAAAYKHVPLVEDNVAVAVENNAFGTKIVADEAIAHKVERFVLISTDKAVRPTNVMGASKRMAELVIQDAQGRTSETIFCMVRFGNVLGSSGSVIPLFRKQISKGGPITLTHREVTRYFMTVSEAAQLVLQAGILAKGGEVFLLDMGEPVKLLDLAKLMIQLSGNQEANSSDNISGIEIKEVGLRPGEKLYEELLVSDNASGTPNPKIMKAVEKKPNGKTFDQTLKTLKKHIDQEDVPAIVNILVSHADLVGDRKHK